MGIQGHPERRRRRPVLSLTRLRRRSGLREIDLRTGPGEPTGGERRRWARHRDGTHRSRIIRL
ncbi:MAG TPA: hypothetical protein VFZ77_16665 [Acidimicrobiales bacterium]